MWSEWKLRRLWVCDGVGWGAKVGLHIVGSMRKSLIIWSRASFAAASLSHGHFSMQYLGGNSAETRSQTTSTLSINDKECSVSVKLGRLLWPGLRKTCWTMPCFGCDAKYGMRLAHSVSSICMSHFQGAVEGWVLGFYAISTTSSSWHLTIQHCQVDEDERFLNIETKLWYERLVEIDAIRVA